MLTQIQLEISNIKHHRKLNNLINIVKNTSLDEGLNFNIEEAPSDESQNQSAVQRNQSVTAIQEEQLYPIRFSVFKG